MTLTKQGYNVIQVTLDAQGRVSKQPFVEGVS